MSQLQQEKITCHAITSLGPHAALTQLSDWLSLRAILDGSSVLLAISQLQPVADRKVGRS